MARLLSGALLLTALWAGDAAQHCNWKDARRGATTMPLFPCLNEVIGTVRNNSNQITLMFKKRFDKSDVFYQLTIVRLTGATNVQLLSQQVKPDIEDPQKLFMEVKIMWPILKLEMDATIIPRTRGLESLLGFQPVMSFYNVNFTKSFVLRISDRTVGSHPLRLDSDTPGTVVSTIDGDIADINLNHTASGEFEQNAKEGTMDTANQLFGSHSNNITSLLQQKTDEWFQDDVIPKYVAEVVVMSV